MLTKNWNYIEHISYTNLRSSKYRAYHSGDITSAPGGACEFIDIDIPSVIKYGGRYIIMNVLSYTHQKFSDMPECYSGWMMRDRPCSGEIFEPKTVQDKLDLSSESTINVPVILDLVDRKLLWVDLAFNSGGYLNNIESNSSNLQKICKGIIQMHKPNLYDLFRLHTESRGTKVDSPAAADITFSLDSKINPFTPEVINSQFLI